MAAAMQTVRILQGRWRDPVEALRAFADEPWTVALLSGGDGEQARWSYLARDPGARLTLSPGDPRDPFTALADLVGEIVPRSPDGPPFQGGVVGLCAYELGARAEGLGLGRHEDWPDLVCADYPAVLAFDHRLRRVLAVGRGGDAGRALAKARAALGWLEHDAPSAGFPDEAAICADLTAEPAEGYEAAVADVVARIGRGEIFQANVARIWRGRLAPGAGPFDLAARLARQSPAPFAAYLRLPDKALVSNSPERFVRVDAGDGGLSAETRPIKGTARRSRDAAQDARLAMALSSSAKDQAENLMIVDLMRNDLARVCRPGSVETPTLFAVETFANVHHLVSTVTGQLAAGRTAIDLLRAALPPGSITGAPKVQAMKVIAGLEAPRGPFFGVMFWAGADGGLDSSVLIRTAALARDAQGWRIEARAGAGVVADSTPPAERLETEDKISALADALLRSTRDMDIADRT
jgi:para-aminobenzoate synthetase component 1